jgi:small subunit ribosomal protein S8
MVVRDWLSNALNDIKNNLLVGKEETVVWPVNKLMLDVFLLMKQHGFLQNVEVIEKGKYKVAKIKIGKLHECKAIKPRFVVRKKFLEKYIKRYLPARDVGILIISTNKGLMTHQEAIEKGLGGVLIGYCF